MKQLVVLIITMFSISSFAKDAVDVIGCEFVPHGNKFYPNGAGVVNSETDLVNRSLWSPSEKYAFGTCASIKKSEDKMSAEVTLTRYSFKVSFSEWENVQFDDQCWPEGDINDIKVESQRFNMNAGEKWLDYFLYRGEQDDEKFGFYLAKPSEYDKLAQDGGSNSLCNFLVND